MPGFWKKALIYLGLVEEEEELEPLPTEVHEPTTFETVRPIRPDIPSSTSVRRIGGEEPLSAPAAVAPRVSMHVVEPRSFNDAKEIGDKLRVNSAVIMNLQHANADLAKRLVDFASGLTYMAQGTIKKVGERIFLLTPPNVEVSAEEAREMMSDRGFFNQF
ncbi:MAG: cell division protein SepF [Actinobacteria bacterium]|nr:cell division protein SepF [Actinomycetota bacterium]